MTSSYVSIRIDKVAKQHVTDGHGLPLEARSPNATTRKAIAELEAGKGAKFNDIGLLLKDLNADD